MTNKEAILAMINGKKVKKDTWHNGIYMFFEVIALEIMTEMHIHIFYL